MKIFSSLPTILLGFFTITSDALAVPSAPQTSQVSARSTEASLEPRVDQAVMASINVWHSVHGNRRRIRMLGGLRVGNPLREWITDAAIGGQFAINFFTNFLENVRPATRSSMSNAKALWKDIPSEMFGVIGFEFSIPVDATMNALDAVTEYFRHNTIPLHFNEVSNAWNIGGPFEEVEHLNGKIKRAEQCTSHDYSSLFNSVVTWDPDTPIKAIEICADIPSGPEKM